MSGREATEHHFGILADGEPHVAQSQHAVGELDVVHQCMVGNGEGEPQRVVLIVGTDDAFGIGYDEYGVIPFVGRSEELAACYLHLQSVVHGSVPRVVRIEEIDASGRTERDEPLAGLRHRPDDESANGDVTLHVVVVEPLAVCIETGDAGVGTGPDAAALVLRNGSDMVVGESLLRVEHLDVLQRRHVGHVHQPLVCT